MAEAGALDVGALEAVGRVEGAVVAGALEAVGRVVGAVVAEGLALTWGAGLPVVFARCHFAALPELWRQ
ncbi:hypothetical protein SY2F82_33100 [Streptomyces sp. Y2F8-2]|nr:hypothetical protein SY2F82_33100 [Streptomyces sp. Y2F8-2]